MTNVLPPQEKKRLWSFYRGRFILTGSFAFSIALLTGLVALAPTYFMLAQSRAIIEESLATESDGAQDERAEAFKAQAFLREIRPYMTSPSPMTAIKEALKVKPNGILIDHISFVRQAKDKVVLSGSASSRELINAYRKSLEGTELYSSATVPVGDLVAGNTFTITLVSK